MTELEKLKINANQAGADLVSVKHAIQDNGVEVPDGTRTSKYGDLIGDVYSVGHDSGYDEGNEAGYSSGYSAGQSSMVDESKLIPKTVSGSYISVDDVSEIPHKVDCKVESVNLFDEEFRMGDVNSEVNIPTRLYSTQNVRLNRGTQYTFSTNLDTTVYSYAIHLLSTSPPTNWGNIRFDSSWQSNSSYSFMPSDELEWATLHLGVYIKRVDESAISVTDMEDYWFQLNVGDTALPYAPHKISFEEVKVTRCGKNLLNPNALGSGEIVEYNGVPCYKYVDKNVSTGRWRIEGCFKENTQYTFTAKIYRPDGSTVKDSNWQIHYTDGTNTNIKGNSGAIVTTISTAGKSVSHIETTSYMWETAYLDLSVSCLYEGTTALPYEPYTAQTLTPATDGTVEGMTSVSPYMNVFADTEGVNIEVEYNKSWGMQTEYDRFWDSLQENGTRRLYEYAFYRWTDTAFKPKYPFKPINANAMFNSTKLTGDVTKVMDLDCSEATSIMNLFYSSIYITRIGKIDCRAATQNHIQFCVNCYALETIDEVVFKDDGTQYLGTTNMAFTRCDSLKNIKFTGKIPFNTNFQYSPLTKASITSVINALWESASGKTLTLKLSAVNTAFETSSGANDGSTSAEFAALVATKTNWTITMI